MILRRTAELIIMAADDADELRALDVERPYPFTLKIDGSVVTGGTFRSALGDESWRRLVEAMRNATSTPQDSPNTLRRELETVRNGGRKLFATLVELSPDLRRFLVDDRSPRRLVIVSGCPEIQALPWEALIDDEWKSLAQRDISVVRASRSFEPLPRRIPSPLTLRGLFCKGTENATLPAFQSVQERAEAARTRRLFVPPEDVDFTSGTFSVGDASMVHLEGHGDPERGEVVVAGASPQTTPLRERLKNRDVILLWSCHGERIQPWGRSLAWSLHDDGNRFVLGFATALQYKTSGDLAAGFYEHLFNGARAGDPESAVVQERARLYEERLPGCEWASLALWMQRPIDLSDILPSGVYLFPPGLSCDLLPAERAGIVDALGAAIPGHPRSVAPCRVNVDLPVDIFADFNGSVVHLRAGKEGEASGRIAQELKVKPSSAHRADVVLAAMQALSQRSGSALIWSGVANREGMAIELVEPAYRGVVVLMLAETDAYGHAGATADPDSVAGDEPPTAALAEAVEQGMERGQYQQVLDSPQHSPAPAAPMTTAEQLRFQRARYWSAARLGEYAIAGEAVSAIQRLGQFEGDLLAANLESRLGRLDQAREQFARLRRSASTNLELGRIDIELGWCALEMGDELPAERLFRRGLQELESHTDTPEDPTWTSSLGRAARDLGETIARDPGRGEEARPFVQRALLIHALDGRLDQVAIALCTLGTIERNLGRLDESEALLIRAASLLDPDRQFAAWSRAVMALADCAFRSGRLEQCVAIAGAVAGRFTGNGGQPGQPMIERRLAQLAARAHWRAGRLADAQRAYQGLPEQMPDEHARERQRASELATLLGALNRSGSRAVEAVASVDGAH